MSVVITDANQQAAAGLLPPQPARPDLRLIPDAPPAAQQRRRSTTARRSTASSLRDPVVRAEILGDPRVRASVSAAGTGEAIRK